MPTTASAVLVAAMDQAEKAGGVIACKEDPAAFTSDLLAFTGSGTHQAARLARLCLKCPVLLECHEYAVEARASRKTALYGVVAGRLEVAGRQIQLRELTHA